MDNPGLFSSPAEGWAFIPFLGMIAAIGIGILSVLFWLAGRDHRMTAALVTIGALAIGAGSAIGLTSAAASFQDREVVALRLYAIDLQAWAAADYGVVLNQNDAEALANGRTVTATHDGDPTEIRLRPTPDGSGVQLVRPDGQPID